MTNAPHSPTLADLADLAARVEHLRENLWGVRTPNCVESDIIAWTPALFASLRALAERWDAYRVPTKSDDPQAVRAFDSGIQSGLSTAAVALRALLGEKA